MCLWSRFETFENGGKQDFFCLISSSISQLSIKKSLQGGKGDIKGVRALIAFLGGRWGATFNPLFSMNLHGRERQIESECLGANVLSVCV